MELSYLDSFLEKYSNIIFHKNPSNGSYPFGRKNRHDEPNSPLAQLCERAYKTIPQYANLPGTFRKLKGKRPSFIKIHVFWHVTLSL